MAKLLMKMQTKYKEMQSGIILSINAEYTVKEIKDILLKTKLTEFKISKNSSSLIIKGIKK